MRRRDFIVLSGVGATSAGVLGACGHPENRLIPALVPDEQYVPGIDYWKASTCRMCDARCGILVRTREHKANKIEGNPLHPVNRGGLCARGQAGLQALYNPDRIKGPMKRTGDKGSGQFAEISWEEGIKTLTEWLKQGTPKDSIVFASEDLTGVTKLALEHFSAACNSEVIAALGRGPGTSARPWLDIQKTSSLQKVWHSSVGYSGPSARPWFDIANATFLLSFGARFLETWHSPVGYSLAYGEFRRRSGRTRGRFVQIEPRMSLTAANADEWLPAAPGSEGLVALAIAQVIIREGLSKSSAVPDFIEGPLDAYAPEQTAGRTDLSPEKLITLARELAASERPLIIGADSVNLTPIHFLNTLLGNLNQPGGVLEPTGEQMDPFAKWRASEPINWVPLSGWLSAGEGCRTLFLRNANPVHRAPLAKSLLNVSFVVSFSPFMDESTELADLILPDRTYLEGWDLDSTSVERFDGSRRSSVAVVSLTQPTVAPQCDARQTANVLFELARQLGKPAPLESAEDVVKRAVSQLRSTPGSIEAESEDEFMSALIERGVWISNPRQPQKGRVRKEPALVKQTPIYETGEAETDPEFPLTLLTYEHHALGSGNEANLPWLQELPDPMTTVMWGSWLELNPDTAARLGIADGDLVEVQTAIGAIRVPAVIYAAIRPDVVAMPYGQGHTSFGRYARNRGANPAQLMPNGEQGLTRAKVIRVAERATLIRFGTSLPEHLDLPR
jgi:anaerobic selenocysteine-containing dehydrogenase